MISSISQQTRADKRLFVMRACAVWLHHQHNLDRCRQKRRWVLCSVYSSAAAAVAIGQLQSATH